jgi:hypothetical protein
VSSGDTLGINKANTDAPESIYFVVQLADAGVVQAIPLLENKFARMSDELTEAKILSGSVEVHDFDKANVASALVTLGDTKDVYFQFLAKQTTLAIDSDMPEYLNYDAQGKNIPGPSRQFTDWAELHNHSGPAFEAEAIVELPAAVALLGRTGDRRAIPLLRRALLSPNYGIQAQGARGLAKLQDTDSIPLIVEACRRAPAGAAAAIAQESLIYFRGGQAESAVEAFIPKDRLIALRDGTRLSRTDPYR